MNFHAPFARLTSSLIASFFICMFVLIGRPLPQESLLLHILFAACLSGVFSLFLAGLDLLVKKFDVKIFNTIVLGLCIGIFFGNSLVNIFETIIRITNFADISVLWTGIFKVFFYFTGVHLGIALTQHYQESLHLSIPFVRFSEGAQSKKDIVLDETILSDPRILDFLSTGILNNRLILPSFVLKHLQDKTENSEEHVKANARKLLCVIDKLKAMKNLELKESKTDFSDLFDVQKKILRLAKMTKSNVLVGDSSKLDLENGEVQYLNLNNIANSLKNVMSTGETIEIKVQRYGKEPKQGVGYLEDGTMVVINNGGEFIGETIETQVISVKQTSAGRIIFTNALIESHEGEYAYESSHVYDHGHN